MPKTSSPYAFPTLALAVTLSAFLIISACGDGKPITGKITRLAVEDYAGKEVNVDFTENRTTLLVFWATWCQPCIMEIPSLIVLHEKYRDRDFKVVSVNVDDPGGLKVAALAKRFGINYPLYSGDEATMQRFGGVNALPTSFVIDKQGRIVEKIQGLLHEEELERRVLAVLNSKD